MAERATQLNTQLTVDWTRYWAAADGEEPRTDGAFLVSPRKFFNSHLVATADLPFNGVTVLLGEAGGGKSHELHKLAAGGVPTLDLGTFGSESTLQASIRDGLEHAQAVRQPLLLDSLDEALVSIRTASNALVRELDRLKDLPPLVVACRTAAWPTTLAQQLAAKYGRSLDGKSRVVMHELCMLRREDVALAAGTCGVDAEWFLSEVEGIGIEALASTPVTLFMLLSLAGDARLPETRAEIYRRGLRKLCEQSGERRERQSIPRANGRELTPDEMIGIARRIAACDVLCGRTGIALGDIDTAVVLRPSELAGGCETEGMLDVAVNEPAIRAVVMHSGLFRRRGDTLYQFAHRSYAEHLAAEFIHASSMPPAQLEALLTIEDRDRRRVVPQLQETAAALADLHAAFRTRLLESEPEVLLRSDLRGRSAQEKRQIAEGILQAIESGRLSGIDDAIAPNRFGEAWFGRGSRLIRPLRCDELDRTLAPWIRDDRLRVPTRDAAIEIAHDCRLGSLADVFAELALDPSANRRLRISALYALKDCGSDSVLPRLRSLALGDDADDADDEMKGAALHALYPAVLTFREVLSALTRPKDRELLGLYRAFITTLAAGPGPSDEDLPAAMAWAHGLGVTSDSHDDLERVITMITSTAWDRLDAPGVLAAFAEFIVMRAKQRSWVDFTAPDGTGLNHARDRTLRDTAALLGDTQKRRTLIAACLEAAHSPEDAPRLVRELNTWHGAPLGCAEDFTWALSNAVQSTGESARVWAAYTDALRRFGRFDPYRNRNHLELWLDARSASPAVAEFLDWPMHLELGSPQAKKARADWLKMKEHEDRAREMRKQREQRPSREDLIRSYLELCEGNDVRWFTYLCDALVADEQLRTNWTFDICDGDGWKAADRSTQERVRNAAVRYLVDLRLAFAGDYEMSCMARAALLIGGTCFNHLAETLGPARLLEVASPIMRGLDWASAQGAERRESLLRWMYDHLPEAVEQAVCDEIERTKTGRILPATLDGFRTVARDAFKARLLELARTKLPGEPLEPELLAWLIEESTHGALQHATDRVHSADPAGDNEWSHTLAILGAIIKAPGGGGWPAVKETLDRSDEWARRTLAAIAPDRVRADDPPGFDAFLSEPEAEELLILLFRHYNPIDDPERRGGYRVDGAELAREWRGSLLHRTVNRGTPGAIRTLERLAAIYPEHEEWLRASILSARKQACRHSWSPPSPYELLQLRDDAERRHISSGEDLLTLLAGSIERWETHLREEDTVTSLWNQVSKGVWRPKDEAELSNLLNSWLRKDLVERGIVLGRELQLSRRISQVGQAGKRVDIWVEAARQQQRGDGFDRISAVIEVKGSWNPDARDALKSQLVDRYLTESGASHGLYVVGWFDSEAWDQCDRRHKQGCWGTLAEASRELRELASAICEDDPSRCVRTVTPDFGLR